MKNEKETKEVEQRKVEREADWQATARDTAGKQPSERSEGAGEAGEGGIGARGARAAGKLPDDVEALDRALARSSWLRESS